MKREYLEIEGTMYYRIEVDVDCIENYQIKSFYYQRIPGVRSFQYCISGKKGIIYYPEKKEMSLKEYIKANGINKKSIHKILKAIAITMEEGSNFLLYNECFLLDENLIQVKETEGRELILKLLYVPLVKEEVKQLKEQEEAFLTFLIWLCKVGKDMEGFYLFTRCKEDDERISIQEMIRNYIGSLKVA